MNFIIAEAIRHHETIASTPLSREGRPGRYRDGLLKIGATPARAGPTVWVPLWTLMVTGYPRACGADTF
ncbi:hypothetical protein GCM10010387_03520 [Streptomyces inusitatus]|uniref:Uncharacterized protein n=1 Tax=Streptomyces inusitatus TaxID=68221 RepID=A0A918UJQ9_9ACTN|nr:hypothetical protein GCM10010387_03520 [Streptomyces inusitatus]